LHMPGLPLSFVLKLNSGNNEFWKNIEKET
jgi:hypothetical protein